MDCQNNYKRTVEMISRKTKKCIYIGSGLFAIILFALFVKYLFCSNWFSEINLDHSISPLDLFNITITAFIAIWLGRYVTRKITEQRFIKEFVIADIYKIENLLDSIDKLTRSEQLEIETIFTELSVLRNKIDIVQRTAVITEINNPAIENLTVLHSRLFNLATDADGDLVNLRQKKTEIDSLVRDFIISLREIICKINKSS